MTHSTSLPVRGTLAGLAGAATLALWFFVFDAARGEPLATVAFLAGALVGEEPSSVGAGGIVIFTLLHTALFVAAALGITYLLRAVETAPSTLYGFVFGFVLFNLVFYLGVGASGPELVAALGWPEVLGGNVLAGIVVMRVLRALAPGEFSSWWESMTRSRVVREGVTAGVIGGGIVALWFLVLDLLQGQPLYTPGALGSALFLGAGQAGGVEVNALTITLYSMVHFGTFIAAGVVASAILIQADERPNWILLGGLLFATFAAFLLVMLALFAEWIIGTLAWWNVALGNLLATLGMGWFLLRAHPKVRMALASEALLADGS